MTKLLTGIRAKHSASYASIERFAAKMRRILAPDTELVARLPVDELFEQLDRYKVRVGGVLVPIDNAVETITALGRSYYDPDRETVVVALSEQTYEALLDRVPRAIYTTCHEIGHAAMHTSQLIELGHLPHSQLAAMHRGQQNHPAYMDTEWQANAFAAALLVPACALAAIEQRGQSLRASLLEHEFGVSFTTASIRLDVFRQRRNELIR